jgi:hypothetical protein
MTRAEITNIHTEDIKCFAEGYGTELLQAIIGILLRVKRKGRLVLGKVMAIGE